MKDYTLQALGDKKMEENKSLGRVEIFVGRVTKENADGTITIKPSWSISGLRGIARSYAKLKAYQISQGKKSKYAAFEKDEATGDVQAILLFENGREIKNAFEVD